MSQQISTQLSDASSNVVDTTTDLEKGHELGRHLTNSVVTSFSWEGVSVAVKDRKSGEPLKILDSNHGCVKAGSVLALMGPSGSGKTTLLNVLAHRTSTMKGDFKGKIMINGQVTNQQSIRKVSSYVEQEDAMIGILTTYETVDFAARLSLQGTMSKKERIARVNELIESFGLQRQKDIIVGTPLRKGLSGGQTRRLSVASQLVTSPRILFLDEPTSGLDSAASFEVMNYIKQIAKEYRLICIASIHQPSTTTFELFDQLMLLSEGRTCYFGALADVDAYFNRIDRPIPVHINPAEFLLDLVNGDFSHAGNHDPAHNELKYIQDSWSSCAESKKAVEECSSLSANEASPSMLQSSRQNALALSWILLHRNFIKSYRDIIAYGTRVFMYFGLAIMMGTHTSILAPMTLLTLFLP